MLESDENNNSLVGEADIEMASSDGCNQTNPPDQTKCDTDQIDIVITPPSPDANPCYKLKVRNHPNSLSYYR
jgi:hypothetical protein